MGRYGLIEDTSEEDSFDSSLQPQSPRKRTYPIAFPTEQHEQDIYPYNAVPVVVEEEEEWKLSLGLTSGAVMECFRLTLEWVGSAVFEYGGKLFAAGTILTLIEKSH